MTKKILATAGLILILAGCGQSPELNVNADNNAAQNSVATQPTQSSTTATTQPTQTDLTDTTAVNVTQNSEATQNNANQNLAMSLSKEVVHFDFDKYNIKPSQMPIVQAVANILKDTKTNYTVRIEGNCDEWGSDEYNYALGLKRAKIVKQALIDLGVPADRLTIISYGKSNPVCTAHTKECWAKNRRDNFTLLP